MEKGFLTKLRESRIKHNVDIAKLQQDMLNRLRDERRTRNEQIQELQGTFQQQLTEIRVAINWPPELQVAKPFVMQDVMGEEEDCVYCNTSTGC